MNKKNKIGAILIAGIFLLSSCASLGQPQANDTSVDVQAASKPDANAMQALPENQKTSGEHTDLTIMSASEEPSAPTVADYEIIEGTGTFINFNTAQRRPGSTSSSGDIVLNFEKSDIREVIKTILGDMLGVNYMVDPAVSGTVSLATTQPISIDAVLPTLETLLRMNGAVLTKTDGIYTVVPASKVFGRTMTPRLKPSSRRGYQILIVPLRYIAATEMESLLRPLLPDNGILSVDAERNHMIIGGTQLELEQALETVQLFDVNQMKGKSIGLFRLQTAEASDVRDELQTILGADADGPLSGMMRFVTIDRLNALIVISNQKRYLQQARIWIEKLDRADQAAGQNMYVYPIQNGRAENLAALLSELFVDRADYDYGGRGSLGSGLQSPSPVREAVGENIVRAVLAANATSGNQIGDVRIIADTENNALIIMASRADYNKITVALRRLDVMPLQVLVEATIVEVALTDELSYGLQWFFKNGVKNDKTGVGELFPLTVDPSFSYTVTDRSGDVRAVLQMLAGDARLNVISAPSLMVLDNRTATIKVGDQVPIRTSETTSLSTSGIDPLVTSTIQYRDTGVLLEVTPRVNPGGMVMLEITQDVNDVDQTTTSGIDSPTIIQRRITTSVAVQSGETVVLGGLIRDNKTVSDSGVPGLRKIPLLGRLFSSHVTNHARTELIVLITPTAISNITEAREATQEMRRKVSGIDFSAL